MTFPRKLLTASLLLSSLFCSQITATLAADFYDVPADSRLATALDYLVENEIITGHPDGSYQPEAKIIRVETLVICLRSAEITINSSSKSTFSDVDPKIWYADPVATGLNAGIIQGYSNGLFEPNKEVNLAEFLKMFFESQKVDLSLHQNLTQDLAPDVKTTDWFAPYFSYAKTLGLVLPNSDDRNLNPGSIPDREQIAEIVYDFLIIQNGGDAQKFLKIAEANLAELLIEIKDNRIEAALTNAENALEYIAKAQALAPTDSTVTSAQKIAEALKSLVLAYQAKQAGETEVLENEISNARNLATQALAENPSLSTIVSQLEILLISLIEG